MTLGFYEQLDVATDATLDQIKAAYASAVDQIEQRKKRQNERGLDCSDLDEVQQRIERAWEALSHAGKRRRYNAFRAYEAATQSGALQLNGEDSFWDFVSGALPPPTVHSAVELLLRTSSLTVGQIPRSPGQPKTSSLAQALSSDAASLGAKPDRITAATQIPATEHSPPPKVKLKLAPTKSPSSVDLVQRYGYSGMLLREARLNRGLSLQQLSHSTKISIRYLEALEAETFDVLPSPTFVEGYLREIARELRLDADMVARAYLRRMAD